MGYLILVLKYMLDYFYLYSYYAVLVTSLLLSMLTVIMDMMLYSVGEQAA